MIDREVEDLARKLRDEFEAIRPELVEDWLGVARMMLDRTASLRSTLAEYRAALGEAYKELREYWSNVDEDDRPELIARIDVLLAKPDEAGGEKRSDCPAPSEAERLRAALVRAMKWWEWCANWEGEPAEFSYKEMDGSDSEAAAWAECKAALGARSKP